MSLHFSNGRLLLKNTFDNQWYYLEARIGTDLLPHIMINQTIAGDFSLSDYDEYAIIRADDGVLYKLGLTTNGDGVVTYSFDAASLPVSQLPVKIFVKDSNTGLLYSLTGGISADDGNIYPAIAQYTSTGNNSIDRPFRRNSLATTIAQPCRHAAAFFSQSIVIVGPNIPLPVTDNGAILIGEGGEDIIGEGNSENIEGQ
jgi:hypothetical protein